MTDLSELIERVKAATGPDRQIDRAIAKHFKIGWDYSADWPTVIVDGEKTSEPTAYPYTFSIDAAIALAERVLPGWHWNIGHDANGELHATVWHGVTESDEYAPTAPLAIVLATLLALQSSEQSK